MGRPAAFWTSARIAALVAIARDGGSFSEAAEALGTTRNAVAGKANRLGVRFVGKDGDDFRQRCSRGNKRAWDRMEPEARRQRIETIRKAQAAAAARRARREPRPPGVGGGE